MDTVFIVFLLALVCEIVDSSVGMGYGTILSPLFILMGLDPLVVVPAILISQAIGGFVASRGHHRLENASVWKLNSKDFLAGIIIGFSGVIASVVAAIIAVSVSKHFLQMYIGSMVLVMGLLMLTGLTLTFSWFKISIVALISAFNKGMSGGGYGPIVTSGQMIAGQGHRSAIGITTFAEVPICLAGFISYLMLKGTEILANPIMLALCGGAGLAGIIGPHITKRLPIKHARTIIGIIVTILGCLALFKGGKV